MSPKTIEQSEPCAATVHRATYRGHFVRIRPGAGQANVLGQGVAACGPHAPSDQGTKVLAVTVIVVAAVGNRVVRAIVEGGIARIGDLRKLGLIFTMLTITKHRILFFKPWP